MRRVIRRLLYAIRQRRAAAELVEEIEFHRVMKERELAQRGVPSGEIASAARRELGSVALAHDTARDVWLWPWLQSVWQDLRFAGRLMVANRWFTLAAVLALALGIGATNTAFTIVNAVLLRGLPVEQPDRIVFLGTRDLRDSRAGMPNRGVSFLDCQDWRASARAFTGIAAFSDGMATVGDEGRAPERVPATYVSAHAFRLLGERPILGRDFLAADDRPGAPAVALLGHDLWRTRYAADPAIVGRVITLNRVPTIVVGVMPEGFKFPFWAELWQPLAQLPGVTQQPRDARPLSAFGRLADGVGLDEARADLAGIGARLARDHAATNKDLQPTVSTLAERYVGGFAAVFFALMAIVSFVLLVACGNVASLMLARSAHRSREIALRVSLGATRWRIVRQLLVESLALAACAGLLGYAFSVMGLRLFSFALADMVIPYWVRWTMDGRVWGFLTLVCLGTGVMFGLAPALHVSKTNMQDVLKDGGHAGSGSRRARRWTSALVIGELALTLVVLTGAGLIARSVLALYRADRIVDTASLVTMQVALPEGRYGTAEQRGEFYRELEARLAGAGPIAAATMASALPFIPVAPRALTVEGRAAVAGERPLQVATVLVGERYFETMGVPVVRGRAFTARDGVPGEAHAIVNQRFAAAYFPHADPIGRRIQLTRSGPPGVPPAASASTPASADSFTIVGVSPTVRQNMAAEANPVVYLPFAAEPPPTATLIVRGAAAGGGAGTNADTRAITALVREQVRALDPDLPVFRIMRVDQVLGQTLGMNRVLGGMFAVLAGIALVLSAVGLYAITTYAVAQRTQEIGVRIALGARAPDVWWLVLRQTIVQLTIGFGIGLCGALSVGPLLRTMLVETGPRDPLALASVGALLVCVSLAACWWPARRATQLDPVAALRND